MTKLNTKNYGRNGSDSIKSIKVLLFVRPHTMRPISWTIQIWHRHNYTSILKHTHVYQLMA